MGIQPPGAGVERVEGEITYLNLEGGYGMAMAEHKGSRVEFFFHAAECGGRFEELAAGETISFLPGMSAKGPRGFQVERKCR